MPVKDYAFLSEDSYVVNQNIYHRHSSYRYGNCRSVSSLYDKFEQMDEMSDHEKAVLWKLISKYGTSKPTILLEARNYEKPSISTVVDFLIDTGADVSLLNEKTTDLLGINRDYDGGDVFTIKGISGKPFVGIPRWMLVSFGNKLNIVPVLVPPNGKTVKEIEEMPNILGRAAIINCFLICFDNKRLYTFPRLSSEP